MKKTIYSLAIVILLYSCKKNVEFFDSWKKDPNFPVTLYADKITYTSDVKMYIGQNKITDKNTIDKFIGNDTNFEPLNNDDISTSDLTIHFHSKDSAICTILGIELSDYSVQKEANQFLFYSSLYATYEGGQIIRQFIKHTSELIQGPWSWSLYSYLYFTKEVRVGYGSYTNLEMCFLIYKISKNYDYSYSRARGIVLNEFNEEAINTLQLSDTLAVQEFRIRFVK